MTIKFNKMTLGLGVLSLLSASQVALAHTTITSYTPLMEGGTRYANIAIAHACLAHTPALPIVANSTVFPTINPTIKKIVGSGVAAVRTDTTLGQHFGQLIGHTLAGGTRPMETIANLPGLIQSRDIFNAQIEQRDSLDRVIGFVSTRGNLGVNLTGLVPFQFGAVFFAGTDLDTGRPSCASQFQIETAIADICDIKEVPPFAANRSNVGVNLWIDKNLAGLGGIGFTPAYVEAGANTGVLTINRDTAANPYPANCAAAGGAGTDPSFVVKISPSADDVARLQFPGWGTPAADSTFK